MLKLDENKKSKDISVEILRIIAIFMVIGTHIALPYFMDNTFYKDRIVISCFVGDGVAIFWVIMGFFYFNNQDYKSKIKKMSKKIMLPLIIWSIIFFYFYRYISGEQTIAGTFIHSGEEYISLLFDGILKWQNVIDGAEHFWFLYIYILLVISFPILNKIREWIDKLDPRKTIISILGLLIVNDIGKNQLMNFSHYGLNGMIAATLLLFLGYILYKNKENIKFKNSIAVISIIVFIIINVLRSYVLYNNVIVNLDDRNVVFWYSAFGFINTIILYYIVNCFSLKIKSLKLNLIIQNIGDNVFYIYIIHPLIIAFFNSCGIRKKILNFLDTVNCKVIIYQIIYTFLVFAFSFILSEIYVLIKKLIKETKANNKIKKYI